MKKILSGVLALILMICAVATPFSAFAQDSVEDALGEAITSYSDNLYDYDSSSISSSKTTSYKGVKYYSEGRELYTKMRDKIDRMEDKIPVHYLSSTQIHPNTLFGIPSWRNNTLNLVEQLIMGATDQRLSVTCTDGDYSRWNFYAFSVEDFTVVDQVDKGYLYSFNLVLYYRYDKNMEPAVTNAVNTIVNNVRSMGLSDYEAMVYIHDYICDSTTYDFNAMYHPNDNPNSFSAYGALVGGKCVCQGYALAFYRVCKELGYDVRFVSSDPNVGKHAWNLINLDGKYYFVDCTWDDSAKDGIKEDSPYAYFLVDYTRLMANDEGTYSHLLFSDLYSDSYFTNKYTNNFSPSSYDANTTQLLSKSKVYMPAVDYKYTGSAICPSPYITDCYGNPLTEGVDYVTSYSNNVQCGIGTVVVNGIGAYAGMATQRSFNITPVKTKKPTANPKDATDKSIKLTFDDIGATGYYVQMYKNGKWATVGTSYSNSYTVKGLSPLKSYKFRAKAFESINRNVREGSYSNSIIAYTAPKKIKLSSASVSGRSVKMSWTSTKADGYQIQYSPNKSMKKAKSVKVKGANNVSKTIKGLSKGKKYYIRVRAYKKVKEKSGKTNLYYGVWSGKKAVSL